MDPKGMLASHTSEDDAMNPKIDDTTECTSIVKNARSDGCIGSVTPKASSIFEGRDPRDEDGSDVLGTFSPEERISTGQAEDASHHHHGKVDVLSVVIQKLTELVKSSESVCNESSEIICGNPSSANTHPKENKKPRGKRQNKTHLYKCPSCPCLFAVRKRDLKKGKKVLCVCCEKLKKAKAEATESSDDKSPPQVVPLESWKVVCDVCSQWVSDYPSLLYHLASHPEVKIFKCKLCDFVTTKHENIESHYESAHNPKETPNKFICSICSKFDTTDLSKMGEHLKSHDENKLLVLKCSTCGYTCRSEEVLRYHMVAHVLETSDAKRDETVTPAESLPFKCSICGYRCDKLSTLKSHSWRHAGDQSCAYPVEEYGDGIDVAKTTKGGGNKRKTTDGDQGESAVETPSNKTESEDNDEGLEDGSDLSRLAIGCCGQKGQTCCFRPDSTEECHCASFDVPVAQQPVLKEFFKEVVSKPTDIIVDGKAKDGDSASGEETPASLGEEGKLLTEQHSDCSKLDGDNGPQEEDDKINRVLEECSSLMNRLHHCADKESSSPDHSAPSVDTVDEAISCVVSATGIEMDKQGNGKSPERKVCRNPDSDMDAENEIIIMGTIGMDDLLENTGSVVEVSTSSEPYQATGKQGNLTRKRLLTSDAGGESCQKKQVLDNLACSGGDSQRPVSKWHINADHTYQSSVKLDCPFCSKILPDFKTLKRHLLDHCRERVLFRCETCSSKFCTEALLAEHNKKHESEIIEEGFGDGARTVGAGDCIPDPGRGRKSSMKCSVCDRKFRTKASLYIHERDCAAEKKSFACLECDFVGVTKDEVTKHISDTHKKPYKCALCNYISATPSGVKNHMKFHAVDKRYKCHLCDFSGAYPQSLKSHLKIHTSCSKDVKVPFEQYKCKLCGYISCHLPSMKTHMWRHARDPGFDYNAALDEIIRDAKKVAPKFAPAAMANTLVILAPLSSAIPRNLASHAVVNRDNVLQESLKGRSTATVPQVIFKCTQCGFQSNTKADLVHHLKEHLMDINILPH